MKNLKEKINLCACGVSFPHYHRDCDGLKNPIPLEEEIPPQIKDWEKEEIIQKFINWFGDSKPNRLFISKGIETLLAQETAKQTKITADAIEMSKEGWIQEGMNKMAQKIHKLVKDEKQRRIDVRQEERQKMAREILKEIEHITELYTKNDFNLDREILAHLYRAIKKVTNR